MKPTDFINSINKKTYVFTDETKQYYIPFVVNKWMSIYPDCLFHCNLMNIHNELDSKIQYDYLFNAITKKSRFIKWEWPKRQQQEDIDLICKIYKYSPAKAKSALMILTEQQLSELKKQQQQGGVL